MALVFPSGPALNDTVTDHSTGAVWFWDGTKWVHTLGTGGGGGGGGTVTSITAGPGLLGGTITTVGTISLATPVSLANGGTGISAANNAALLSALGGQSALPSGTVNGQVLTWTGSAWGASSPATTPVVVTQSFPGGDPGGNVMFVMNNNTLRQLANIRVVGSDDADTGLGISTFHSGTGASDSFLWFYSARGTRTAPAALQAWDKLGYVMFEGFPARPPGVVAAPGIFCFATQTWTANNRGASIDVYTTANNSYEQRLSASFGTVGTGVSAIPAVGIGVDTATQVAPSWPTSASLFMPNIEVMTWGVSGDAGFGVTDAAGNDGLWLNIYGSLPAWNSTAGDTMSAANFSVEGWGTFRGGLTAIHSGNVDWHSASVNLARSRRSSSTSTPFAPVQNNDLIGVVNCSAVFANTNQVNFNSNSQGAGVIAIQAAQNWTTSNRGARMYFQVSPQNGSNLMNVVILSATTTMANMRVTGTINADSTITPGSDARDKENIGAFTRGLDVIRKLKTATWTRKGESEVQAGLVAQEVEPYLPEAVVTRNEGKKYMDPMALIGALVNAVNELTTRLEALETHG
jgi:hypothetical protein